MKDHVWIPSQGQRLSAMVHIPDDFATSAPVIVCCHGFTADKVGTNHLTRNVAEGFEALGYAVVRFDYRGSGDSDGNFVAHTVISGWKQDLASVLDWVSRHSRFAASPILLYGHSLGGLIVLTHPQDERIIGRLVFAPVVHPVLTFRDIILGPEAWAAAAAGEMIEQFYGKGFALGPRFVQDILEQQYSPIEAAAQLTTPLFIVHGIADEVVLFSGSVELLKKYKGEKKLLTINADHVATGTQAVVKDGLHRWLEERFPIDKKYNL